MHKFIDESELDHLNYHIKLKKLHLNYKDHISRLIDHYDDDKGE